MAGPLDTADPEWERQLSLLDASQRRIAVRAVLDAWDYATRAQAGERLDLAARLELLAMALDEYEDDLEVRIPGRVLN